MTSRRSFFETVGKLAGVIGLAKVVPPGLPAGTEGAIVVPKTNDVEQAIRTHASDIGDCLAVPRRAIKSWSAEVDHYSIEVTSVSDVYRRFAPCNPVVRITLEIEVNPYDGFALAFDNSNQVQFIPNKSGITVTMFQT